MHRGRVVLGAVLGGALAVAVATQVGSWSPDDSAWDGYSPTGPTIEPTPEPLPADYTTPPECQDEWEAALRDGRVREAQEAGATVFAVACQREYPPPKECEGGADSVQVPREDVPGGYVTLDCRED